MRMGAGTSPKIWYRIVAMPTASERILGGDVFRMVNVHEGLAANTAVQPKNRRVKKAIRFPIQKALMQKHTIAMRENLQISSETSVNKNKWQ